MSAHIPSATYRLQLNSEFTLGDATGIVEYLYRLGISDCYTSPLTQARPGSRHCYDVTDHGRLNPEIGGVDGFREFARRVQRYGMGIIVDIVPNHMCIADPANQWWSDVLENGPSSPYASFFDIDWQPPKADLANKVLLPVLADQFGRVLENGELSIACRNGAFAVAYLGHVFPLAPRTWTTVLETALARLENELGESSRESLEMASIVTALNHLPLRTETDAARVRERQREKEIVKERLAALMETNAAVRLAVETSIADLNGIKGEPHSFDRLETLLHDQAYRLSFWHVAADEINYRRFFDVNDLAAIRVEHPDVFSATHALILRLVHEGLVSGLRIDHVDGLRDPGQYLHMLQHECTIALAAETGPIPRDGDNMPRDPDARLLPFYIVVEKILGADEPLRANWPIHGTTGYEFLNDLNGLYVDSGNCERLVDFYLRFTRHRREFSDIVYDCKKLVLRALMSGEQNVLARKLDRISEQHRWSRDFTLNSLGRVLAEVIACFPVYRSYVTFEGLVSAEDHRRVMAAINTAKRRNAALSESTFDFLASVLLLAHPDGLDDAAREARLDFALRFQQLTSPVMAKGFEDTALYRFYPLASFNEVGGDPTSLGISVGAFHARNERRFREWPHSLSATSTHDTKRGEDVRARINVLSEIPDDWEHAVRRWNGLNNSLRIEWDGACVPDANEEYLFYQTLVGAWPLTRMTPDEHEQFIKRIQDYMDKSSKEAKFRTSWVSPNATHDRALSEFVRVALQPDPANAFLADFVPFRQSIAMAGVLNSLSQALIKAGSPGVPDFYQGTELWDYNLVDPDSRRPVDFVTRRAMLEEIIHEADRNRVTLVEKLLGSPEDGRIKMYVIHRALQFRRNHPELFATGAYVPLEAAGERARHVVAFARRAGRESVIIAAGRFFMKLGITPNSFPTSSAWSDTKLALPPDLAAERYVDLFTGCAIAMHPEKGTPRLPMDETFARMPIAMLVPSD
ncbi:MAG: malto-oligosyltrehalose synthase [Candidatus Binataceae bacterium]